MIKKNYKTLTFLLAMVLILACTPVLVPSAPPTLDPIALNTAIAQTAAAALTKNAALHPTPTFTLTPLPTRTPTEVPSPTPTFIFILPTNTVPSPTKTQAPTTGSGGCEVISQDPANNSTFSPGKNFDATWLVRNRGTKTWDENSADYRYASGDKIHRQGLYDLPMDVPPGGQVEITVAMKAPKNSGTYSTTWEIRMGNNTVCSMSLKIIVS